jgi:RNA polymerase sigma factor (sigma-70 family)
MSENVKTSPPSLSELLQHAAWTRHLARSLVGGDADDVVQETWLAAIRRPPDTTTPLRPWLGTVVRHNAFNRSREASRRGARETRAETREAPETAEALLARFELHKILVDAVDELAEPYRQTVLLAYFEGLASAEIGERQNVPPGTVRGRLKTALALLREALDRRLGDRGAWLASLTSLAASGPGVVGTAATGVAAFTVGALTLFVGVLAILATGVMVWKVTRQPAEGRVASRGGAPPPSALDDAPPAAVTAPVPVAPTVVSPQAVDEKVSAYVQATERQLRERYPAIPPSPSSSRSPGLFSYTPPESTSAGVPCTVATKGQGIVVQACAAGGRVEARKLMKAMVKEAKTRGVKVTCDGCHHDLDSYALTEHAREDFEKLEAVLAKP